MKKLIFFLTVLNLTNLVAGMQSEPTDETELRQIFAERNLWQEGLLILGLKSYQSCCDEFRAILAELHVEFDPADLIELNQLNQMQNFQDYLQFLIDNYGGVALLIAVVQQNLNAIKRLVHCGVNINTINPNGTTALFYAAARGYLNVVEELLKQGAAVDAGRRGHTALMEAAYQGREDVAERLIAAGADVNARTQQILTHLGHTPLYFAAIKGHLPVVKRLIAQGANPNALVAFNSTIEDLARERGQVKVADFLRQHSLQEL